ncbi:SsgA family sporulation/cell division regulator [Streptomyces sp. NPDC051907]|uniref:SsgA family sporulation/cell division regulator n=1 Tax=Streptomyces sp. NPDC051907 TaxID=3155284 RepID=UPI00341D697A
MTQTTSTHCWPHPAGERVGAQVEWIFARELLVEGLRRSSGAGDVTVYRAEAPLGQEGPMSVFIRLSSPE